MAKGDPVEFVRHLPADDQGQTCGNRVQLEAFELAADHVDDGANADVVIQLGAPGVGRHWRFNQIHASFDANPAAAVVLTVADGTVTYSAAIATGGPHNLGFGQTRWASNAQVTITLPAGGAGVTGYLAILGARHERDIYS